MKTILIAKERKLGDSILVAPTLDAIREQFPDAHVTLSLPEAHRALYEKDDRVQRVVTLAALPNQRYDIVINLHASPSSRRRLRRIPSPIRIFHHHSRSPRSFGSTVAIPNLGIPMAAWQRDLNAVRALGWQGAGTAPRLQQTPLKKTRGAKPIIVLGLQVERLAKRWPTARYAELCRRVGDRAEFWIPWASAIRVEALDGFPSVFNGNAQIIPVNSVEELIGLTVKADVYVGSDSGLKHLSAALGLKTLTLFGPESIGEWHGYPKPDHTALQVAVKCRDRDADNPTYAWCGVQICPLASHACMTLTDVDAVESNLWRLLSNSG